MAMTLRTDDADDQALARLAARDGVSKHEAALRAIRAADSRDRRRAVMNEIGDQMLTDWQPVFDVLAQT